MNRDIQKPYIYILLRKDLDKTYQIIQAGHALFEHALTLEKKPEQISSFCLLELKDENELEKAANKLERTDIPFTKFFEPDYSTGFTAIAAGPIYDEDRNFFKKFKFYKG